MYKPGSKTQNIVGMQYLSHAIQLTYIFMATIQGTLPVLLGGSLTGGGGRSLIGVGGRSPVRPEPSEAGGEGDVRDRFL